LIHEFEQFRSEPYIDPVGIPTIGWGNTYYEDGKAVRITDPTITLERGNELFKNILRKFELGVCEMVVVEINQSQFDALVSFSYNVGLAALSKSTLLKKLNAGEPIEKVKAQFLRWNKGRVNGKLKVLNGLTRRRIAEAELYGK